ncbi:MAG: acylphosphatase [Chloroflexi bacterium]|jgi:acylphosphatase|nr:acylphosphatase [Chloroflexota bacterium]
MDPATEQTRKALYAVVHGRVQGVGFRAYTQDTAIHLGLVGYVTNRWDGTVELLAEGSPEALRRLLSWLERGPTLARVERVEVRWDEPRGQYDRFEVH